MLSNDCLFLSGSKNFKSITSPFFYKKNFDFIKVLSKSLLEDKNARKYPEIVKFAFWSRESNLNKIYNSFDKNILRFGRGTCLHILPGNTSINFAYSLVFGLLSGNSNILRVPNVDSLVKIITKKINLILSNKNFKNIKQSNCIISYNSETNVTQKLSSICDVRVLWGGDKTIRSIKKIETQPNCIDITFPDRYSFTIINSEKVDLKNIENLIVNFYNDSFFMDQNACSSPHLVLWQYKNKKKLNDTKKLFWNSLSNHVKKNYNPEDEILYQKYVRYCENFLNYNETIKSSAEIFKNLYITKLKNLNFDITKMRGLAGTFYEYDIVTLNEIKKIMNYKLQTINYFGFDKKDFIKFFSKPISQKGILRVVKVGNALNMSHIWDGYNIIDLMSKTIELD